MITHLTGSATKFEPGEVVLDVHGVGYLVSTPLYLWDGIQNGSETSLWVYTYVREDRLELYGFEDRQGRNLFEALIGMQGIGPKMALELCSAPRPLLLQSIVEQDSKLLSSIKGIGAKKAEKILIELKSLIEKQPEIFGGSSAVEASSGIDQDALEGLKSLGYDTAVILQVLKEMSDEVESTEERVAEALKMLA